MEELRVPPGPGAPRGVTVPLRELQEHFSHASGPGGQGVNTSDSRVQLSLNIASTTALSDEQRARVLAQLGSRLSGGVLTVSAEEHRAQRRNRVAARQRMAQLLSDALVPPTVRRASKPTRGSQRRRLESKRQRSQTKQGRRRPGTD